MSLFKRQDKPDGLVLYDDTSTSNYEQSMPTSCAWCSPASPGDENGSHTICSYHAEQMMQSAHDRRANKKR